MSMFGLSSVFKQSFGSTNLTDTKTKSGTFQVGSADLIGGIIGAIGNIIIGGLNYSLQKEQYEWQKRAWKQQMRREDNAMQRRMLDLQMAGLSPTLAVGGSGASASGPPNNPAPQLQLDPMQSAALMVNLLQGQKNISKTQAEIDLLNQNTREKKYNTDLSQEAGVPTQNNTIFDKYFRSFKTLKNKYNPWSDKNRRKVYDNRQYNPSSTGRKY